jgi:hypothetical protein
MKISALDMFKHVSGGKENYVRAEIEDFLCEVGLEHIQNNLTGNAYELFEARVAGYSLTRKLCTDTNVGMTLYFFDDTPLAYGCQSGRKSSEKFTFVSKRVVGYFREFLLSLEESDYMDSIELLEEGEDFVDTDNLSTYSYHVDFNSEWLNSEHLPRAYYKGSKVVDIELLRDPLHPYISQDVKVTLPDGPRMVDNIKNVDILVHIDCILP